MKRTKKPTLLVIADDEMLQRRLEHLLTSAIRRQLWITFLDGDDRETGVIMPCDDYPLRPDEVWPHDELGDRPSAVILAHTFAGVMREFGFASLVAVWERPGDDTIQGPERRWASAFADALRHEGAVVRAQFLLHDAGMRQIGPDDLDDIH